MGRSPHDWHKAFTPQSLLLSFAMRWLTRFMRSSRFKVKSVLICSGRSSWLSTLANSITMGTEIRILSRHTALTAVADQPKIPGSYHVPRVAGARTFHLRFARRLVAREWRVNRPRHLIVYRVAPDGMVEILSLVHDRMLLSRAVQRARRGADG